MIQDIKFSICVMPLLGSSLDAHDLATQAHSKMNGNHHVLVGNRVKVNAWMAPEPLAV